jgi:hypothetical protein
LPGTCLVNAKTAIVMANKVRRVVRNEGLVNIDSIYVELRSPGKEDLETADVLFTAVEFEIPKTPG